MIAFLAENPSGTRRRGVAVVSVPHDQPGKSAVGSGIVVDSFRNG